MSRSPIAGFMEGSPGKSRHSHEPIGYSEERAEPPRCRVIMTGGAFTPAATEEDRQRAAAAQRRPPQPPCQAELVHRKRAGRPARLAHLKPEVARLRAEGLSWPQVGKRLNVNPQAARMLMRDRRKAA